MWDDSHPAARMQMHFEFYEERLLAVLQITSLFIVKNKVIIDRDKP